MTFQGDKTILNLCLKLYILRNNYFVREATLNCQCTFYPDANFIPPNLRFIFQAQAEFLQWFIHLVHPQNFLKN